MIINYRSSFNKKFTMIKFSMLLINNNRSKAYLQNILLNDFIPEKVILLNDQNVELPEHTYNDKIISKFNQ